MEESVKYLQKVPEDLMKKMIAMEKLLSKCNALATAVTDREKRM